MTMILLQLSAELEKRVEKLLLNYIPSAGVTTAFIEELRPSVVIYDPSKFAPSSLRQGPCIKLKVRRDEHDVFIIGNDGKWTEFEVSENRLDDPFLWGALCSAKSAIDSSAFSPFEDKTLKRLKRFAGTVAHDVRAPLASICMRLEVILEPGREQLSEQSSLILEGALKTGQSLSALVQTLYEFAKYGKTKASLETISPRQTVFDVVDALRDEQRKALRITVDELPHVQAVPQLLRQVFQNILDNAIKYRKEETVCVEISCEKKHHEQDQDSVKILVKDNARGFCKSSLEKLNDEMNGGDSISEGLGLGISIVEQALELQGGSLSIRPGVEEGSEFILTLRSYEQEE